MFSKYSDTSMKKLGLFLSGLILFVSCSFSRMSDVVLKNELTKRSGTKENNGKHITAFGKVNALFLFIQFDDDSTQKSDAWTYDTTNLPAWAKSFVNEENDNTFPVNNLSQYFHELSFGNFELTGYVFPKLVRPKYGQDHYKNIGEVNSEILVSLDSEIDYSKFDNWKYLRERQFENSPDGIVDLIFLVYRNFSNRLFFDNGWTGSAELYLEKDIKTKDGVTIKKGQMKSGLQMRGGIHGFDYSKYVAAHEFGHFLFGAIHIDGLANLSLMNGGPAWNACRGMISWEREQLGWINYFDADTTDDRIYVLDDYMTTGQVLRVPMRGNECFLIENRQKKSIHDWAGDKGLYFYHIQDNTSFAPRIDVLCADGNWKFEVDKENQNVQKTLPDRAGKNEMNFTQYASKVKYACYSPKYKSDSAWGDSADAFDEVYNNVLSPVSNPSSANKAQKQFAVEVIENINGVYKLKIFFDDVYEGKPSKPQGLTVKTGDDFYPRLEWMQNEEPDLNGYKIYRIAGDPKNGNKTLIGFIQQTEFFPLKTISWSDAEFGKNREKNIFFYAVTAVDNDGNESVLSEVIPL